jgi:FtsH-binding integral membrane protein
MTESNFNDTTLPGPEIPASLRVAATLLRGIFLCVLAVMALRVTMPEKETLFSAYVPWGDLVRMALGLAVCVWLAIQLFKMPKTTRGYRVWLYFGLVAVPVGLIVLVAIW